ncbi:MAG: redoxin domain-containing protein [Candidatus Binatia bacterium]
MHMLKSLYVSTYITASLSGLVAALLMTMRSGLPSPWLGAALACAAPVAFFATVFTLPIARTSPNLHAVLGAGIVGTLLSFVLDGGRLGAPTLLAATVGIGGTLLYVYWYSRFAVPADSVLREGAALPTFSLVEDGREIPSRELLAKPALWIFYRGNWCPLCVAQVREISAQYRELARRGVEVFLVSPQPEANTAALAAKCDAPMRFMSDRGNRAATALGILEKAGVPAGMQVLGYDSDVPRPTVFITAKDGTILYCDLSENYRVRPEPAQYFAVLDRFAIA